MTHSEKITNYGEKYNINPAIIAAVANVESGFNEEAVSNKGAVGLMQLMPSTAKWLAGKAGVDYNEESLKQVDYSLNLGSLYLSYLIDFFQDERLGICAYNAGQGNVSSWLSNKNYSSDGKTLTVIPFAETRNYLVKVLNNYNYYKNKYK